MPSRSHASDQRLKSWYSLGGARMKALKARIQNPKRRATPRASRELWYPYYAGFSEEFAQSLIASWGLKPGATIADPWNGSGTTTAAALNCGYASWGFDLNPAMVVVSKARLLSTRETPSLLPIARDIATKAQLGPNELSPEDPLLSWFAPRSAVSIRNLECALQKLLVESRGYKPLREQGDLSLLSDLAA